MATSTSIILKPFIKAMDSEISKYIYTYERMPSFDDIYSLPCFNLNDDSWRIEMHGFFDELISKYPSIYISRQYQTDYINKSIMHLRKADSGAILLHAPTGSGKTYMIMNIVSNMYSETQLAMNKSQKNIIIVFVSPLLDINDQCVADKYLHIINKELHICKINSRYGFDIDSDTINKNIIISTTYISLQKTINILNQYNKNAAFIVCDECHTMPESIHTLINTSNRFCYKIYASATPLNYQIANYNSKYGHYIRLVKEIELMDNGYLARLNTYIAEPDNSEDNVSIIHAISKFIKQTHAIKICCFVNSRKNGDELAVLFNKYTCDINIYSYFSGSDKQILHNFTNDTTISIIISCKKLCMGVDIPAVNAIIFVDNKMSYIDISQCIGRGLRPYILPSGKPKVCNLLLFKSNNNNNIKEYLNYMHKSCGYNIIYKAGNASIKTKSVDKSHELSMLADYEGSINVSLELFNEYNVDKIKDIYTMYKNADMLKLNKSIEIGSSEQLLMVNVANNQTHKNFINSVIYRIFNNYNDGIWGFKNTPTLKKLYDKLNILDCVIMFDKVYAYLFTINNKQIDTLKDLSITLWSDAWKDAHLHIYLFPVKVIKLNNPRLTINKTVGYSDKYNWQGPLIIDKKDKIFNLLELF